MQKERKRCRRKEKDVEGKKQMQKGRNRCRRKEKEVKGKKQRNKGGGKDVWEAKKGKYDVKGISIFFATFPCLFQNMY